MRTIPPQKPPEKKTRYFIFYFSVFHDNRVWNGDCSCFKNTFPSKNEIRKEIIKIYPFIKDIDDISFNGFNEINFEDYNNWTKTE